MRRQPVRAIELFIDIAWIRRDIDSQLFHQGLGNDAIGFGTLNGKSPSIPQAKFAADAEFVSLGMPAKVVVVVQDQYSRLGPGNLTKKVGRGKPADPASHHHQVIDLSGVFR